MVNRGSASGFSRLLIGIGRNLPVAAIFCRYFLPLCRSGVFSAAALGESDVSA